MVLDDVWSRLNLENMLFEGKGYKILVTTRDCSIICKTISTQSYELPLLDDDNAMSLFCFWSFAKRSIPSTIDEHLVKKVCFLQQQNRMILCEIYIIFLILIGFSNFNINMLPTKCLQ